VSDQPKSIALEDVLRLPLQTTSQAKAVADKVPSVEEGRLKVYDPSADNAERLVELMRERMTRALATSLTGCVHCGLCAEACHYALARPDDPAMTPAHKADQIRRIFKRKIDWTGRVLPGLVHAGAPQTAEDLNELKNMVFGTCSACRRCTYNCPMGVDNGGLIRFMRGILAELGIVPEGVFNVSRDQWETGNQMGVTETDYLETIDWVKDDLKLELPDATIDIPLEREGCDFMYSLNPREIKFDPRSLANAAKVFAAAGETWTLPKFGWDQTNFGLFSGDDKLGGYVAKNLYEAAIRLKAKRIVISECGHGYRSTRWEGYNWAKYDQNLPSESVIMTLIRYISEGRIKVDPGKNTIPVTFHDSCNIARSGDLVEEPRWILKRVCSDFREMYPNGRDNFCCTGGSGLLSMAEYRPLRMEVAKIKAEQLAATGAKIVVTQCHNCVDGLNDVIKHYKLGMKVVQILDLVADALVPNPS
jgi:Fe-S oxidoreductase